MSGVGAAHSASAAGSAAAAGSAPSSSNNNFAEGDTGAVAATVKPVSASTLANADSHHNEEDKEEEDEDYYDDHPNGCGCCGATLCYD